MTKEEILGSLQFGNERIKGDSHVSFLGIDNLNIALNFWNLPEIELSIV